MFVGIQRAPPSFVAVAQKHVWPSLSQPHARRHAILSSLDTGCAALTPQSRRFSSQLPQPSDLQNKSIQRPCVAEAQAERALPSPIERFPPATYITRGRFRCPFQLL